MNKSNKFSPESRERAVRMVQEQRGEYPSLWAAVESIAPPQRLDWLALSFSAEGAGQTGCGSMQS